MDGQGLGRDTITYSSTISALSKSRDGALCVNVRHFAPSLLTCMHCTQQLHIAHELSSVNCERVTLPLCLFGCVQLICDCVVENSTFSHALRTAQRRLELQQGPSCTCIRALGASSPHWLLKNTDRLNDRCTY